MQYASPDLAKQKLTNVAMTSEYAGSGGGGGSRYPTHNEQRGEPSSSVRNIPSPKHQHNIHLPTEFHQPQHNRTISSSYPGSPVGYTVSPATREGSVNALHQGFPPCRSHAPTHSRMGDSVSASSAATDACMTGSASDLSAVGSPLHLRHSAASPPTSPARALPTDAPAVRRLQQLHAITAADATPSQFGVVPNRALYGSRGDGPLDDPGDSRATHAAAAGVAPLDESAYTDKPAASGLLLSSSAGSSPLRPCSGSGLPHSGRAVAVQRPPAGGASSQSSSSPSSPHPDVHTIVSRRHSNGSASVLNGVYEGRSVHTAATATHATPTHYTPPTSSTTTSGVWTGEVAVPAALARAAALPAPASQRGALSPPPPPPPPRRATVVPETSSPHTSPKSGCLPAAVSQKSPQQPPHLLHNAGDKHQSDSPSSCTAASESATPQKHQPQRLSPAQGAQRGPAMFGVIDLSYSRGEANSGGKPLAAPPAAAAGTTGSSRAPASVKTRAAAPSHSRDATGAVVDVSHSDAAPAPAAAFSGSVGGEITARYGTTIVRLGHNSAPAVSSSYSSITPSTESNSRGTTTGTSTNTTTPGYSPLPPPPPPPAGSNDVPDTPEPLPQQPQRIDPLAPQHPTSVAPAAVAAARLRKHTAAAAPINSVDAVRRPERPTHAPVLTPDTVLPVAAQDEDPRHSSSTNTTATTVTTRSSSTSHAHPSVSSALSKSGPTTTPTSTPKSSAPIVSGAGVARLERARVAQSTGSAPGAKVKPRDLWAREKVSPAVTGSNGASTSFAHSVVAATNAAAAAVGASTTAETTSPGNARAITVRRGSASSTVRSASSHAHSTAPVMASYTFVSSRQHMQRFIDQWRDRFEEDKNAYKEGGYLTVTPGRIVHSRYVLIQKLGWGEFSTVWLGYDTKHATLGRGLSQAFVAVKVAKCRSSVQEATHYEVSLLRYLEARLPRRAAITNIIDCFDVHGDFGMHTCMVMPLCGPNLLSVIDRMKAERSRRSAEDLRMIKEIIISVLMSLHELSVLNVVHTDIKPENVLCCAVDSKLVASMEKFCSYNQERSHMISLEAFRESVTQQTSDHLVCLADFGLSALLEPPGSAPSWAARCGGMDASLLAPLMRCKKNFPVTKAGVMENQRGTLIQTREYRAPEVLLGLDFTCATDVWSVGCMAFELITGSFLMDPKKKTRETREMDIEHLAMMMQLIGPLPAEITNLRVRNNSYYDAMAQGVPAQKSATDPPPEYLHRFVDRDGNFMYASRYRSYQRRSLELELEPFLNFREARLAANFILSCLFSYDPKVRPSAKKLLGHQWFQGVGVASKDRNGTH